MRDMKKVTASAMKGAVKERHTEQIRSLVTEPCMSVNSIRPRLNPSSTSDEQKWESLKRKRSSDGQVLGKKQLVLPAKGTETHCQTGALPAPKL